MKQTLVLAILDGWGIGKMDESNPIYMAKPQMMEWIHTHFPGGALQASGIMVGLPWGEEGNSEVGHLTLGAGKVLYQYFPRILLAIKDGSFYKNEALERAFTHTKESKGAVHLVGLSPPGTCMRRLTTLLRSSTWPNKRAVSVFSFTSLQTGGIVRRGRHSISLRVSTKR